MTARSDDVHDGTTRRFGDWGKCWNPLANGAARHARVRADRLGLGDGVDVEDLVQEARMEIWRHARGFDAARGPALPPRRLPRRLGRILRANMRVRAPVMTLSPGWKLP